MHNVLLTTDGRSLAAVEKKLRKYLPGLDVRLWPVGPTQAVLRAPIVRAIETDYPSIGAGPLLAILGISRIDSIDDEASATLIALRDTTLLPPRSSAQARAAAGGFDWHLNQSGAAAAWLLLGGPDSIAWGGVVVGHIDTGYTRHPALGFDGASWIDTVNARTFVPAPSGGEAALPSTEPGGGGDNLEGISAGHGTRMAAAISGHASSAAGGAFYGVAPKVPLVPVRITDSTWMSHRQREFAQALRHLVGAAGAKVVNVSLGIVGAVVLKDLRSALDAAYEAGVIVICAAGNIVNPVVAPARLSRTLAVGGVTADARPWAGSSYGPETDFSGYAAGIRRAHVERGPKFSYAGSGDGTSYATAMTSGAAALWLAHHGAALDVSYPLAWQRVEAFRTVARQTARVPTVWNPGAFGSGILDIDALLRAALPPAAATPAPHA